MTFHAFGLNYEYAPVETTEAFSLDAETQERIYRDLILGSEAEVVLLSTCNRTEAFLYGTEEDVRRVQREIARAVDRPWPTASSFHVEDEAAVRHVLQLTSGIRSMVVGDGQILAQVKNAYRRAVNADAVNSLLHRLMHTAFRAAKQVATETDLASGAASVSTAAVAMATEHFAERGIDNLQDARVLLVGAGKMGRLAIGALDRCAPQTLAVTNRSPERAQEVAGKHRADVVDWSDRHAAAAQADVVIVATGAPEPVICRPDLPAPASSASETLFVDISMPRNVDPGLDDASPYVVFDLDDLKAWTEQVREERGSEIPRAEEICEDLLSDFVTWVFHQQALQPAIQAIRSTFDSIREQEVDRHAEKTGMNREEVDRLTKSIMQKLLAVPIVKLKNVDPDSISFVQGIQLLHALFSRPTCEDDRAQTARAASENVLPDRDGEQPSLSDAPSECPYTTHDPDQAPKTESGRDYATELLRQALQAQDDPQQPSEPVRSGQRRSEETSSGRSSST